MGHSMTAANLLARGKSLFKTLREMGSNKATSKEGILNMRIDLVSDELLGLKEDMELRDLSKTVLKLSEDWSQMQELVGSYISTAHKQMSVTQEVLAQVQDYVKCNADSAFVEEASSAINDVGHEASHKLKEVWPRAMSLLKKHVNTFDFAQVVDRTVKLGADRVLLSDKPAKHWYTPEGVQDLYEDVASTLDEMPLDMSRQVLAMFGQVSFLHERLHQDSGSGPEMHETQRLGEHFDSIVSMFQSQLSKLQDKKETLSLMSSILDSKLALASPAPGMCKELAFEQFKDGATSEMIALDSNVDGEKTKYVVTQSLAGLLSFEGEYRISLAEKLEDQTIPADFPISLLHNTYVCTSDSGKWSLAKAAELSSDSVAFCSGSMCQEGDYRVGGPELLEKGFNMTSSVLMQTWSGLSGSGAVEI